MKIKNIFRQSIVFAIFVAIFTIMGSVYAQIPANIHTSEPIMLKGASINTQSGPTIENGMLLMEDGIIKAVGTDLEVPEGIKVIDLEGRQVYPSLIHGRNLMGLTEIGQVTVTSDFNERGDINPNVRAEAAFHPESSHIGVGAASGVGVVVTTPSGGLISGLSAAMYTDGWTWEQMIAQAPLGLVVNWPNMINNKELDKELQKLYTAFNDARRYHSARTANAELPLDIRWEAMRNVFEKKLPVYVHANELSQIQAALSWAKQEDINIILTGARDAAYIAEQIADMEIPVMITPVIGGPARQWEYYGNSYALPARLHQAGVEFFIAGDFGAASIYRLAHHAAAAVAFGLPEEEALKAITLYPAQIMGLENMGSLESGKAANIIITDGSPLDFSTQVLQMFLNGREIDLNSKHQQLYDKYHIKQEQLNSGANR